MLDLLLVLSSIFFYINIGPTSLFFINVLLILYLLIISITDFKFQIIPDKITYLYILIGTIITLLSDNLMIVDSIIGMLCGFLLFISISIAGSYIFKKPAIGGGDIKLAAMLGIFVGWDGIILSMFIASVIAMIFVSAYFLIYRKRILTISFGPFLVFSVIVTYNSKENLIEFYFAIVERLI